MTWRHGGACPSKNRGVGPKSMKGMSLWTQICMTLVTIQNNLSVVTNPTMLSLHPMALGRALLEIYYSLRPYGRFQIGRILSLARDSAQKPPVFVYETTCFIDAFCDINRGKFWLSIKMLPFECHWILQLRGGHEKNIGLELHSLSWNPAQFIPRLCPYILQSRYLDWWSRRRFPPDDQLWQHQAITHHSRSKSQLWKWNSMICHRASCSSTCNCTILP